MTPSIPTATFDLHGHTAIVTGANHGIGAATARVLAHCGAGVFLTYLRQEQSPNSRMSDPSIGDRSSDAQHVVEGDALEDLVQRINSRNMLLSNSVGVLGGQVGSKIAVPAQLK